MLVSAVRGLVEFLDQPGQLGAHEVAEGLVRFAADAALPDVLGEAGQNRRPRSPGQLTLHAEREELGRFDLPRPLTGI